jgi:oligopeptide transport system permease protein
MRREIGKRLIESAVTIFVIVSAIFFFVRAAPGGPFDKDRIVPESVKAAYEAKYRLNLPLHKQYGLFLRDLPRLDFGPSIANEGQTVQGLLKKGLPVTFTLGFLTLFVFLTVGITSGVLAAVYANTKLDHVIMAAALMGIVIPVFVLGPMLAYIVLHILKLDFSPYGWGGFEKMILPVLALFSAYAAVTARLARAGMIEALGQDYILVARAKGLGPWTVILRHALIAGFRPVISYLGPAIAGLFGGGSLVIEILYEIPGFASYFLSAASDRDYPMILGTGTLYTALIISLNLVTDLVQVALDPRQRRRPQ